MAEERTREAIARYDTFKLVVTILLAIGIGVLMRWNAGRSAVKPTITVPVAAQATATPSPMPTPGPQRTASPTAMPTPTLQADPPVLVPPEGEIKAGPVTLAGTGTPGSKVRLVVDGEIAVTTVVDQGGRWTLATTIHEPGRYQLQVQTVSEDGDVLVESAPATLNVGPAFVPLAVQAPEIGEFITDLDGQASGQLTLLGTGEPGAVIHLVTGDQIIGSTKVNDDGTWKIDEQLVIRAGEHDLSVQMLDAEGNVLTVSETTTIEIKGQPALAMPTLDLRLDGGELTLAGTGTPGSRVDIVANGQVLDSVVVGASGRWSVMVRLGSGEYVLIARAVDAQGRTVAESEAIDYVQPESAIAIPALTAPLEGAQLASGRYELSGVGTPETNVEILDNGSPVGSVVVQADGTWTVEYQLDAGAHVLAVQEAGDPTSLSQAVHIQVIDAAADETSSIPSFTCPSDPAPGIDQGDTYVVARCEYMALIAQRTGVSLEALIAANPQIPLPALIYPDQVLNMPPRSE